MLDASSYRDCPTCGSDTASPVGEYSPDPWQIGSCDGCGFVYLRNPPAYEALQEDFAWEKTHAEKKVATGGSTPLSSLVRGIRRALRITHRDKNARFRKWFNDGHVMDVGCGTGARIVSPMTPYGIELSNALHAQADAAMQQRGGFCIHGPGAEAIWKFDPDMFDGIIMFSYLEHETDVHKVLTGAHRTLKADGGVFVRVPNYGSLNRRLIGRNWCGFRYPDHVNYFTLDSLRRVAAKAGFTTQLINRFSLHVDDNISVLLRKAAA